MQPLPPDPGAPAMRRDAPTTRAVVLTVLGVVMVSTAVVGGAVARGADGDAGVPAPWFLLTLVSFTALFFLWPGISIRARCRDGRVLEGLTLLGWRGVDLQRLTWVGAAASTRSTFLVLLDDRGRVAMDSRVLRRAGPGVAELVGRAVWAGQLAGRYTVPPQAARFWGMPISPVARPSGLAGTSTKQIALVAVVAAAIAVGVLLGSP
ncbi:hypothetical protein [Klenkia sp. PcliD-1-E]|uniref:hypothetical protein n=1 Tax=Klenkia sp. PcliD-1-E TaxID=2954492 RepID=UPI002098409D|nr:hypothetical protein [Klenkia sp. PcliD-1-E]MCO7220946.1 hypothetical protein [Klenkia sp. PcliD-1-E]